MTIHAPGSPALRPRALVVEDDPDVSQLLRTHLRRLGWDAVLAGSGEEGLELARDDAPDLVVLDIVLPGLDGFAVLRELRACPATTACTVVATTILDSSELADAGFDGVLPKPFTRADVAQVLSALAPAAGARS